VRQRPSIDLRGSLRPRRGRARGTPLDDARHPYFPLEPLPPITDAAFSRTRASTP
jgi:hypothetical protein